MEVGEPLKGGGWPWIGSSRSGSVCLQEAHRHFSKPVLKAADLTAPSFSTLTSLLSILWILSKEFFWAQPLPLSFSLPWVSSAAMHFHSPEIRLLYHSTSLKSLLSLSEMLNMMGWGEILQNEACEKTYLPRDFNFSSGIIQSVVLHNKVILCCLFRLDCMSEKCSQISLIPYPRGQFCRFLEAT